mgnify:CR=1 FL=1
MIFFLLSLLFWLSAWCVNIWIARQDARNSWTIFPPILLDNTGSLDIENNPKIIAAIVAIIIGYFSRSIIATIFAGLISYWFLIFVYYQ